MRFALAVSLSIAVAAAVGPQPESFSVAEIASPAGPGSSVSNLTVSYSGQVLLSWIESLPGGGHSLRFSRLEGERWSTPATIASGDNWFVNWADFPSLAEPRKGLMAAHWLVKRARGTYHYDVHLGISNDGGKSWSQPIIPHRDGVAAQHGFVSFFPWSRNEVGLVWLDGRNMKEEGAAGHGSGEMALRFTTVDSAGRLGPERVLDERVCECCQTSAASTSHGILLVYRDRSPAEIRDTGLVRFARSQWSSPRILYPDNWKIHGCPVNGPAVDAIESRVAVAWFHSARSEPHVLVAFSSDAGATFGRPVSADDGAPVGRVDVELLEDASALVSWIEETPQGAEVRVRRVYQSGRVDPSVRVAPSSKARSSGFPRMVRSRDKVVFSWTDSSQPSRVRTAISKRLKAEG